MPIVKTKKDTKKDTTKVQKTIEKKGNMAGVVKDDFEVDEDAKYTGTCVYWNTAGGYGFIKLDDTGVVPDDKVMVYWKNIESEDRWPSLYKGFQVEMGLKKVKQGRQTSIRAKDVHAAGGAPVNIQEEKESKREYVGEQNMRFLGNVKFYDFGKGFGYVNLQEGYDIDSAVPKEIRVHRIEIQAGTDAPRLKDGMEVEFGIQKNKKDQYSCYKVTLPGGDEIARNLVEGREELGNQKFDGKVTFWNRMGGYGWIAVTKPASLPAAAKKSMQADFEKRKEKAEKAGKDAPQKDMLYFRRGDRANFDAKIGKDVPVTFRVYKDNQGVGAFEVECK